MLTGKKNYSTMSLGEGDVPLKLVFKNLNKEIISMIKDIDRNQRNAKSLYQSVELVKGDHYSNAVAAIINMTNTHIDVLKQKAIEAVGLMKACGVTGKQKRVDLINSFTTASKLKWYLFNSAGFGRDNYNKVIDSK